MRELWVMLAGLGVDKRRLNTVLSAVAADVDLGSLAAGCPGRTVFDVWRVYTSNFSDAHCLIPLCRTHGVDAIFYFCGFPYYRVEFVDSLVFELDDADWDQVNSLLADWNEYWQARWKAALRGPGGPPPAPAPSGYGFGIAYASGFLKRLAEESKRPVAISVGRKANPLGFECARLVSSPRQLDGPPSLNLVGDSLPVDRDVTCLRLKDLRLMGGSKQCEVSKPCIRVPFKRPVALPLAVGKGTGDAPCFSRLWLPESPALQARRRIVVLSMGGAEHNLGLLHFVNCKRWEPGEGMAGTPALWVRENRFDEGNRGNQVGTFTIGTEGEVAAINNAFRQRENNANEAEVLRWEVGLGDGRTATLVVVYGFSAPMSQIAFASLLLTLKQPGAVPPGKRVGDIPGSSIVTFGSQPRRVDFFNSPELAEFDQADLLNTWGWRGFRKSRSELVKKLK